MQYRAGTETDRHNWVPLRKHVSKGQEHHIHVIVGTSLTSNKSGEDRRTVDYDAFGQVLNRNAAVSTPGHLYNGKPRDPMTGLVNYGFRDYAPRQGRFTTVDPIRDGTNWYGYVTNDPLNLIDRYGLETEDATGNNKPDNPPKNIAPSGRKHEWTATTIEYNAQAVLALPDPTASTGLMGGLAHVLFENQDTSESFSADYTFVLQEVSGIMASFGTTFLEFGIVKESFPAGTSYQDIAESYEGPFNVANVSVPVGIVSIGANIVRGNENWVGGSGSLGLGFGGGFVGMRINYELLGTFSPDGPSAFGNLRYHGAQY